MPSPVPPDTKDDELSGMLAATIGGIEHDVPPPLPTCPVCMEPWTCNGVHRICCIPCGHVYGRSCLEKWLHRSGHDTVKCPQCGKHFENKLIINLYAPGNLWDGCCRLQEVKAHYRSKIEEQDLSVNKKLKEVMENVASAVAHLVGLKAVLDEQMSKVAEFDAKKTELTSLLAKKENEFTQMERKLKQELATSNVNLMLVKEKIEMVVAGGRVEHADLIDIIAFMEQNCPATTMSHIHNPPIPPPIGVENRREHPDELPLCPKPPHHPADVVIIKRRRTPRPNP